MKKRKDARQSVKAVNLHELDRSFPLDPQNHNPNPKVPMNRQSDTYKVRWPEHWSYAANRYRNRHGHRTSPLAHDTRGESSSSGAKRKQSNRCRGGS